eukprot:4071824-Prymnesium_polylepis.1
MRACEGTAAGAKRRVHTPPHEACAAWRRRRERAAVGARCEDEGGGELAQQVDVVGEEGLERGEEGQRRARLRGEQQVDEEEEVRSEAQLMRAEGGRDDGGRRDGPVRLPSTARRGCERARA